MNAAGLAEIIAFALSAFIAVAGALGMATTMSMFRSAIFLMASFMGVAGLFILLSADLLGLLQIMMYIGGMLVMVLFMVLFMPDPGGAMMAGMPEMMTPFERLFSLGLAQTSPSGSAHDESTGSTASEPHHTHAHDHQSEDPHGQNGDQGSDHAHEEQHGNHWMDSMDMSDMSMVTPVRRSAVLLAFAIGSALAALLVLRPSWPVSSAIPDPRSAEHVGALLMDKYMIGFEGAGFLILIGIVGAVLVARSGQYPDRGDRKARVAVDVPPPPIEADALAPLSQRSPGEGKPE